MLHSRPAMVMKGYSAFPITPALLEPHHHIVYQDTRWGSLTPLQKYNRCILQPQLTGSKDTHWGSLTPLQRCSRWVYSVAIVDWATRHSLGEYYPSGEIQFVYSTVSGNWASIVESCPSVEMQPVYSAAWADWACWWSLTPLQRCSRCILHLLSTRSH